MKNLQNTRKPNWLRVCLMHIYKFEKKFEPKDMKPFIILLIVLSSLSSYAQDTTKTHIGYDLDFPHLYVRVDTVHCMTQIYNYYPTKMYFSFNQHDSLLIAHHAVFTVWKTDFTLTVQRNTYIKKYRFY